MQEETVTLNIEQRSRNKTGVGKYRKANCVNETQIRIKLFQ